MPDSAEKTQLKMMTAWSDTPSLSDTEIDGLLTRHQVTDSAGVAPGGTGYVATYNLRSAAREGWTVKMGRAAKLQSTDLDGDRMSANQIFDQCERMVRRYGGAGSATMSTSTKEASDAAAA
jgi:hypothetical protein